MMSSYVRTYVRTYVGYSKVVPSLMHPIKQLHTSVCCAPVHIVREERGQAHAHWNSVLSLLEFTVDLHFTIYVCTSYMGGAEAGIGCSEHNSLLSKFWRVNFTQFLKCSNLATQKPSESSTQSASLSAVHLVVWWCHMSSTDCQWLHAGHTL